MKCPHCTQNLLRKQRTNGTCSYCRKPFALDPKTNVLQLHDLRVRQLAAKLRDPRRPGVPPLRYTSEQLRHAASRKAVTAGKRSGWLGCMVAVLWFGGFVVLFSLFARSPAITATMGTVAGLAVVTCLVGHLATAQSRRMPGEPLDAAGFHAILARWHAVYGGPPPGMLPPGPAGDVWPKDAPIAGILYCADPGTSAFLAAAGIVERRRVALVTPGNPWPFAGLQAAVRANPAASVFVLHNADIEGCHVVPQVRAALPGGTRVVDVGLRPRVAAQAGPPVRTPPDRARLEELRTVLDADEWAWLAQGNTFALAAVRPAWLLRAVERAVARTDPEAGRAAGLGFLTWPERAA